MSHTDGRRVRKATRACDSCKARKARCSGTRPCDICTRKGIVCCYDALYLRGKPPTPPASATPGSSAIEHLGLRPVESRSTIASFSPVAQAAGKPSSKASVEPGTADVHGHYIDPASGLSFLHRARRRFSNGEHEYQTDLVTGDWLQQHIFRGGDKPLLGEEDAWSLPPYAEGLQQIEFFFDICISTYRLLHKPTIEQWLATAENNRLSGRPVFQELMHARAATLLGVFAIANFVQVTIAGSTDERRSMQRSDVSIRQSIRLTDYEGGLPTLESVQARMVQVFYHLMTCRFNHAWYIFGNCLQMISAMGLQRRSSQLKASGQFDYLADQHRKRVFWSAYILDKYLGVVLGRPPHFHDEDIDQDYPDRVNDEHLFAEGPTPGLGEDSLVDAFIFNARIARIVGSASRYLYGIQPSNESERLAAITRLGAQIDEWHSSLPPFLSTVKPSSLIRSLRRQSNALKIAHGHALMHLYRPLLLGNGTRQRRQSMAALIEDGATRCIKAAWAILDTVTVGAREGGATGAAFWWTHYVTFCALAVVYVWILQRRRNVIERRADVDDAKLLELAETCQHHLAHATTLNSPSRKYSLILEELRLEARKPGALAQSEPTVNADAQPILSPVVPMPITSGGMHAGNSVVAVDQQQPMPQMLASHGSAESMSLIDTPEWLTEWQNTDWSELDASAFGILSDFGADYGSIMAQPQYPM